MAGKPIRIVNATWSHARIWSSSPEIEIVLVEVVAFTEHSVTVVMTNTQRERRYQRICDKQAFFPTFDEAKNWLIQKCEESVNTAQAVLDHKQSALKAALEIQRPPSSAVVL